MKKIFALTLLLLLTSLPLTLYAQTGMTDSQIMEFIIKENEKGTNRSQIMIKLMERGVSVERVRKIRRNYEKQKKGDVPGAIDISGYDKKKQNRLRKDNSKKSDASDDDEPAFRRRRSTAKDDMIDETQLTERQRRLYNEMKQEEMEEELDFALPDSLEMYDDIMGYDAESRLTKKKKGKQVFGRNIFNNKKLTFESDLNIATPGDYRLGAGDEVYIDVWGASNKTFQGTVSPDGNVDVEGFGPISVGGLTVTQANKRVRATLGQRYQKSQVKLTVGQTK
ncbi:MAG: polysaccharide biosynthesis/export family protein, partial [Alloprevotella sp.]|nr:polysaccharide biosynthesis/export family protein [Alloprevotella sp.]